MPEPRRIPGIGAIVSIAFLIIPIVVVAWWLNHPKGETTSGGNPIELDVVCLGRVDGLTPVATLEPTTAGKVAELFVSEGQPVKARDKLLRLDDESLKLREEDAEQAVHAATIEVDAAKLELQFLPNRMQLQKTAIDAAKNRADAAEKLYQERIAAKGFGTVTAAELISADAEAKQLRHLVEVEKAKLDELVNGSLALRVQAAETRKAMAQITLKQAQKAVQDCILRAPSDGIILRIQTSVGETVVPGGVQAAIVFRPDGPLIIRAELEQEFLGRVKPDMKASIRDDVRADSPTWSGTVRRVGNWVARKRSFLLDPGEVNDVRTVECIIALDGKTDGLLIGQRMRVRIGKPE